LQCTPPVHKLLEFAMPSPNARPTSAKKAKGIGKGKASLKEAKADLLAEVAAPRTFEKQGVEAVLDCYIGTQLSQPDVDFCTELLSSAMATLHKSTGGARGVFDAATKKEFVDRMRDSKSRVFMIRASEGRKAEEEDDEWVLVEGNGDDELVAVNDRRKNLGFLHVQLSTEKAPPSLVVFEMQLLPEVRGKGLGKHVMEVMQMIATKMSMTLVLYNIFKANYRALQQIHATNDGPELSQMAPEMAPLVKAH